MSNHLLLLLLFALTPPTAAMAQPGETTCLGNPHSAGTEALCAQLAAAARLRGGEEPPARTTAAGAARSAGKGALIGTGIGLGIGVLAALVVAPSCEENESRCSVTFIVGGGALGAALGAAVGAAAGRD